MPDLAVIGAGTMGAGIAEVAVLAGLEVVMIDVGEAALARGITTIDNNLQRSVQKNRISADERDRARSLLSTATTLDACAPASFVIEAVFESLQVKHDLFSALDRITKADAVLATNTSALSVARIATATTHPQRVVGMHFFNPVPVMRLVEVIGGPRTDASVIERTVEMAQWLGKTPVLASDTAGFIVNRVARPFYLEGLRLMEAGGDPAQLDAALRGAGFRMGPFELMDLIGLDINLATSESLYERTYGQPRFRPSFIQRGMVDAGLLGRKTGRGFYRYDQADDSQPPPSSITAAVANDFTVVGDIDLARALGVEPNKNTGVQIVALADDATLASAQAPLGARRLTAETSVVELVGDVDDATRTQVEALLRAAGLTPAWTPDLPGGAALRVIAALANEAAFALTEGVASAADIDQAMQLGANYPKGPLAWANELGIPRIVRVLDALRAMHGDSYVAAPILRRCAAADKPLRN